MGSEWTLTTVGSFCPFAYGKGLPQKKRNAEGNIKVYGSNGQVGMHDRSLVQEPGIVIGRKGTVGAVHYAAEPFWPIDTTFYVVSESGRDLTYTYYLLKSIGLENMNADSAVPGLNRDAAHARQILVPEYDEQRAIAHILGSLDDKIELNRRMNQTLEAMARAIFKSWFVDFDPVRAKAEGRPTGLPDDIAALFPDSFEDSELGEIPTGWVVKSLDQIADYLNGLACQKYPPEEGKISLPVIKIRELRQGITENTDMATSDVPASYIVEDGDVLFSWSGSLLIDIWTQGKGVLNQHLFKITSENYPKWFYYYWTDHHLKEFQRIAAYKATTMGHIKRHHLADAKCCVADDDVMKIADEEIAPLFMLRIQNELEVKKLASLRDILLPKLISGELRIPDAEKFIEPACAGPADREAGV